MKPLQKDELFQNLQGFLKAKGLEFKAGSYTRKIQKSCSLLADAINAGQRGFERAREEIDKKLEQLRQVVHEKTAPSKGSTNKAARAKGKRPRQPNRQRRQGDARSPRAGKTSKKR